MSHRLFNRRSQVEDRVARDVDALLETTTQGVGEAGMQRALEEYAAGSARTEAAAAACTENSEHTRKVLMGHGERSLATKVQETCEADRERSEAERAFSRLPPAPAWRSFALWMATLAGSVTLAAVLGVLLADALQVFLLAPVHHHALQQGAASAEETVELLRLAGRAAEKLRASILEGSSDWSLASTRRWALGIGLLLSTGVIALQTLAALIAHKPSGWSIVPAFVADAMFSGAYLVVRLQSFETIPPAPVAVTALELAILITHLAAVHRVGAVLQEWRAARATLARARSRAKNASAQAERGRREQRWLAGWLRALASNADHLQAARRAEHARIAQTAADRAAVRFIGMKQKKEGAEWAELETLLKEDLDGYKLH